MKRIRVIPVLLIKSGGLVKSVAFKNHKYVGDPINAVKIFNEKEVDELAIIDISATAQKKQPNIRQIADIASEAFMPLSYGGGITSISQVKELMFHGIEKVILNKAAHSNDHLIEDIADAYGTQSVVVSIDVKKDFLGRYRVFTDNGSHNSGIDPVEFAKQCENRGAGEILLNSIDRDGTYKGYDISLVNRVSEAVRIPIVACGGAGSITDFRSAVIDGKASAVAAGSMFVFQRPHNAVLINYPSPVDLTNNLYQLL